MLFAFIHRKSLVHLLAPLICLSIATSLVYAKDSVAQHAIPTPPVPTGEALKERYTVPQVTEPPKIDGTLDDPCWRHALHAPAFFRFRSQEPVREQTEAWICADRTHLYFAIHCLDSHPELIRANETQREGVIDHDDMVAVIIDSQGNRRNVSQFSVSARGTQVTQLEGGTADNLKWAGDWRAVTQRTADGWTAEIAIPFSLLRYPNGARTFPIVLLRQLARETNAEIWPYVPPEGNNNPLLYTHDFDGIQPPTIRPKFLYLPYTLATAGRTTGMREGLDIKYPVSTSLTGVATIFPDFQTIEQSVQDLSFSYTEKYVPDRRPFFAEGNGFWPDSFLFYSQRIPLVDAGLKLVGKQGPTTIGVIGTTAHEGPGQTAVVAKVSQELGKFSQIGGAVLGNDVDGQPANRVAQVSGNYGWAKGHYQYSVNASGTQSTLAGAPSDINDFFQFSSDAGRGALNGSVFYTETGANFVNQLGLVPEVDVRGEGFNLYRYDAYDKGAIERTSTNLYGSSFRHMTGGFFHDTISADTYVGLRNGWQADISADKGHREAFNDDTVSTYVGWNQKTLFQRGGLNVQVGHRENQAYRFVDLNQGILVTKRISLTADLNDYRLGGDHETQAIVSGTYRMTPNGSIGGRLVHTQGRTNLYLSYGLRSRRGTDLFILLGDPNSARTQHVVTVKLVRPF